MQNKILQGRVIKCTWKKCDNGINNWINQLFSPNGLSKQVDLSHRVAKPDKDCNPQMMARFKTSFLFSYLFSSSRKNSCHFRCYFCKLRITLFCPQKIPTMLFLTRNITQKVQARQCSNWNFSKFLRWSQSLSDVFSFKLVESFCDS